MSAAMQPGGIEAEALRLWQEPSIRTRREWRWGKRGSLSLVISGPKRGLWHDHESGQGGRLGQGEVAPERRHGLPNGEKTKDETKRIERARRLWEASEPLAATLGERYLIETRGIQRPADGWPEAVRYHRESRSLILAATLADGAVQAVHVIRLTPDAQNAKRRDGSKIKLSYGILTGAMVRLGAGIVEQQIDPLLLAEGAETGLSLWTATGHETWIALGSLARAEPPPGRHVVICQDDDLPNSPAARRLDSALEGWRGQGLDLSVATPWSEQRGDKSDFNDTLREAGPEAVRDRIRAAMLGAIGCAPAEPPAALPSAKLSDAHAYLVHTMVEFFAPRAEGELAPQMLISGQGGIGKTEAAGQFLPHGMVQARNAGRPYRAIVLVPEHDVLGTALLARFQGLGMNVAHLRGRGDPFEPKPGDRNPEAVREALRAKQDVRKSVCGTAGGKRCPFFDGCGYLEAVERAAQADVVVAAHNFIFHPMAKRVTKGVGFAIIDEDFIPKGDRIFGLTVEKTFSKTALQRFPVRFKGDPADTMTTSLAKLHKALVEACEASPDGYLTAAALRAAGLTPADCSEAARLEWHREVDAAMTPDMDLEKRREVAREAAINSQLPKITAAWQAAKSILTDGKHGAGRIELTTTTDRGGVSRELSVQAQHEVASWLADLPVLMLNATASLEDVRRFFPRTEERRPPEVAAPHARTRLIIGGFSNSTLKNKNSGRKREGLRTWLALSARGRAETGLVTHKATVADFALPGLPVLHHGANAGDDSMRMVEALAVIDGIRPPASDVAALAAARTGRAISDRSRIEIMAPVLMRDGSGVAVPVLAYADPAMQAVYAGIHNASVSQAIGRARAVMRTAANPVEINVFGRVAPAGVVIDEVVRWKDIRPDRLTDMILRDRVQLTPATMAALHPDLFSTEKAAERARERFGDVWHRLHEILATDPRPWARVRWQKPGQGRRLEWSLCPVADVAAMWAEIAGEFGDPVHWQPEVFTAGRVGREVTPKPVKRPLSEPGNAREPAPIRPAAWASVSRSEQADPPDG